MNKHFLATVSNEIDHLFGLQFICSFFSKMSENKVTLFHICRDQNLKTTMTSIWDNPHDVSAAPIPVEVKKSIEKAHLLLQDHQVPVDHVVTKTVAEKYGKVKDILAESARGQYDAIVLGRRASYALQWVFDRPADETFQSMIRENSCVSPFWICPDVEPGRKNVLLCIDGSENGYRAVDHVGFILSNQEQHNITLLFVEKTVGIESVEFFERAVSILLEHKIKATRIQRTVVWGLSVPNTIISEAKKGKYAVVAIGLGGKQQDGVNTRVAGPTAVKLISKLEKTSLWCCP